MAFSLTIETGNDAFADDPGGEIARILHGLASNLPTFLPLAAAGVPVLDYNGNTVGRWSYVPEEEEADVSTTDACRHCSRAIRLENGSWVDPFATGDDITWRETCESHDTFTAEHEPVG